jgi:3-oxoacyl-[acyl-carrier-protein] synthase I
MSIAAASRVVVVGLGARASVGASSAAVGAAYRAGVSRHRLSSTLLDRAHRPLVVARDPLLPPGVGVDRRLVEMARGAATEPLAVLAGARPLAVAAVLALPEPRVGVPPTAESRVVAAIGEEIDARAKPGSVEVFTAGRSGGVLGLESALAGFAAGAFEACLLCGVDSYLGPETLDALDVRGELHNEGARWGFVPGEGAAACLLTTLELAEELGLPVLAEVVAARCAVEDEPAQQAAVALGRALTTAVTEALETLRPEERIHRVYADLNGDRHRVDDLGFTIARIAPRLASLPCVTTPADRLGEIGAATAPMFIGLATTAARSGIAAGSVSLICTMGASRLRGAVLLRAEVVHRDR